MNSILYQDNSKQIYDFLKSNLDKVIVVTQKGREGASNGRWLLIVSQDRFNSDLSNIPYTYMTPIHRIENAVISEDVMGYVYKDNTFELVLGVDEVGIANETDTDMFYNLIQIKENLSENLSNFKLDGITPDMRGLYINLFFLKYKHSILTCSSDNSDARWIFDVKSVELDEDGNIKIYYNYEIPVQFKNCGRVNDFCYFQSGQTLRPATNEEISIYNEFVKQKQLEIQSHPSARLIKKYKLNSDLELKAYIINLIMKSDNIEKTLSNILSK